MFSRNQVSVGGWIMFFIIMGIPVVNLIFWLVLLVSSGTNRTLKNLLIAQILVVIVLGVLVFGLGIGAEVFWTIFEGLPV